MLKEVINFVQDMDEDFRKMGLKPKEGLHIKLDLIKQDDGYVLDKENLVYERYSKKQDTVSPFLEKCATWCYHAWMVDTNKCFDLPKKAIHSCSPFCVAFRREHLRGGKKYQANAAQESTQIYDRFSAYFEKAHALLNDEPTQEQKAFEALFTQSAHEHYFETLLDEIVQGFNGEFERLKQQVDELKNEQKETEDKKVKAQLKTRIKDLQLEMEPYKPLAESDYICFYLNKPLKLYKEAHQSYLKDRLFNKADYNTPTNEEGIIWGASNFFNSIDSGGKKPFLKHQTALFEISGRISSQEAQVLHEFMNILPRKTLPSPLPLFIYEEERKRAIALFRKNEEQLSYQQVIRELWKEHEEDIANYYLLVWQNTKDGLVFRDFDFVSRFEYRLKNEQGEAWQIQNLFGLTEKKQLKAYPKLGNIFELEREFFKPLLQNKYKQLNYFNDLDSSGYEELPATFLNYSKYRKPVYDYVYKSKREALSGRAFDDIIFGSIRDELKNSSKSDYAGYRIKNKLNQWFSLYELFHSPSNQQTMASKLEDYQNFVETLAGSGEVPENATIQHFAFAAGQVIEYLRGKSKSDDNSYRLLEPYLQHTNCDRFKAAVAKDFERYKHQNFSKRFRNISAFVLSFETSESIKKYMPEILAGVFANNQLYSEAKGE